MWPQLHSKINKPVPWLQELEFSENVKVINHEGCYKLIAATTYEYIEATIDIFDVKTVARTVTLA